MFYDCHLIYGYGIERCVDIIIILYAKIHYYERM